MSNTGGSARAVAEASGRLTIAIPVSSAWSGRIVRYPDFIRRACETIDRQHASPTNPVSQSFIITRPDPSSGLGANLLSMVGALYLCEQTQRPLVVDWTGMAPLRDKQVNYFPAFFEPIRRWRDVDVLYVNDPDAPELRAVYEQEGVRDPADDEYGDLVAGRTGDGHVWLHRFHYYRIFRRSPLSPAAVFHRTREFFQQLVPRPPLRRRMEDLRPLFEQHIVVALNVRSGNGEFDPGKPYWNRVNTSVFGRRTFEDRLYRACRDCLAGFPQELQADLAIFVVTDAREMQQRLLTLPGAFALRKQFPPPGTGHQFADFDTSGYGRYSDVESVNETIVDMFMMAACAGLVYNESAYNLYAQHMTTYFNGNLRRLEQYFEHPIKRLARSLRDTVRSI
jgi:hypothetical protein